METVIEQQRRLHEEREILERAIVDQMLSNQDKAHTATVCGLLFFIGFATCLETINLAHCLVSTTVFVDRVKSNSLCDMRSGKSSFMASTRSRLCSRMSKIRAPRYSACTRMKMGMRC